MSTIASRAAARLLVVPVLASASLLSPSPAAHADDDTGSSLVLPAEIAKDEAAEHPHHATDGDKTKEQAEEKAQKRVDKVMSTVRSRAGKPYSYGAAGPNAFDCSGLVQWVYRHVGKNLPRTSGAQAGATQRVRNPRVGDLVFFTSGGRVYHVGIYAGNHTLWHASRPGVPVRRDRIWTSSVFYGHVR
ncbi:C40 family peptidase [Nocardioides nitrophenolicus]|uniref:C40 family peptidase n=1 Tax=Nocardioides nitrophenolicus TaxID=60489 RepID=UPI00195B5ED7|nr:C40 family peptidase [Nocardioides nitrophenolicus]MBM7518034.1 cell wall-associated NlpC family hydrolase [Nocardioides nitrophenolicus]